MSSASGPVTKDQVLQALNALYQGTDNVARVQAGNWLEMFQKTRDAWTVSDQIIQDDSTNLTEKTFAAQTFRNKITYDLTQLDFAARASLRDSLVNLLVQHKSSPIALVTQLCLALVDLIIQMPEWANVYGQIKELFSQDEASASILLQILTLLPEELTVNTRIPLTDEEYRTRTMELLEANSADVLSLLLLYLQSTGADTSRQNRVLLCLLAWLRTGYLPMQAVGDSPMVRLAFEALGSEDLFDTACDLIVTMVQETQEVEEHLSLIPTLCELLQGVHARLVSLGRRVPVRNALTGTLLPPPSTLGVEKGDGMGKGSGGEEEADDDDDDDDEVETRRGLCRILTHAGEAYIVLLVKHAESFQGLVQALLTCARQRDLECVGMTLYFWESFTHYLLASSSEATSPLELYTPLFQRLEDTMIRHLQYPRYAFPDLTPGGALTSSENSSTWTLEERDAFRDFRHRMGDTLKDCADALGPEAALKRPLSLLLRHIQTYGQGGPGQGSWQAIEAPLFSLRALGSRVPLSEEEVMPKIMEILSQLPPHPKLRYAATLVISRYTPWTAAHPAFLTYQLNFISSGFDPKLGGGSPEVIQAAAVALNYLCQDCGPMLVDSLGQLHSFYLDVSSRLSPMDLSEVTQALAHVIGAIPDPDRLLEVLRTFSHPILQDLCSLVPADGTSALDPAEMNARATRAIALQDRLAVFLGHLRPLRRQTDGSHPALPLVLEVLPVLSSLLTAFRGHGEFGESISQCYRTLVDTYGDALTPYLSDLLGLFGEAYTATGLSTYIWVSRRCVRAYGRNPAQVEVIASFVEAMSRVVLGRIKEGMNTATTNSPSSSSSSPAVAAATAAARAPSETLIYPGLQGMGDVVEEYFRLLLAHQRAQPHRAIASPLLPSTYACALGCLGVGGVEAGQAVIGYLQDVFALGIPPSPEVQERHAEAREFVALSERVKGLLQLELTGSTEEAAAAFSHFSLAGTPLAPAAGTVALQALPGLYHTMIHIMALEVMEDSAVLPEILAQVLPGPFLTTLHTLLEGMRDDLAGPEERAKYAQDVQGWMSRQEWRRIQPSTRTFILLCRRRLQALRGVGL